VRQYPSVLGLQKNLFFVTHSMPESSNKDDARSHANNFEAEFAVQLAKYLHKQGYKGSQVKEFLFFNSFRENLFLRKIYFFWNFKKLV
jgi:hypothetical protein